MSAAPAGVGLVGCGTIAGQYLRQLQALPELTLVAVCDAVPEAADRVGAEHDVDVLTLDQLLADDRVEVVLNLTTPAHHVPISSAALLAGKHAYQEKPFGVSLDQARSLAETATRTGLRLGAAPDTVLGTGIQTARAALDDGLIGAPVAATAFMMSPGHEAWHPQPGFYYRAGGGPLLDMGVYYLTALVTLLGPIDRVMGMGSRAQTVRTVPEGAPRAGEQFEVEVDTHVTALLQHRDGALTTLVVSFDVQASRLPLIEVYGTAGTLAVPDPNQFDATVAVAHRRGEDFTPLEPSAGHAGTGRGIGLADMVRALRAGTAHRQDVALGLHVHEVMEAVLTSSADGSPVRVSAGCERPEPVPYEAHPA